MFNRLLSACIIVCFLSTSIVPTIQAHADETLGLPAPGSMINLSPAYEPMLIKGLKIHPENPFLFDFIVDTGNNKDTDVTKAKQFVADESSKLIKYFLASITVPEKDLWVNLSPYEKNRIIADNLGQTTMGRDMLAQDYILKQLTASLIYPEKNLGKTFWDEIYAKSRQMYGTAQIPVNTFNKVWIVADKADIFERGNVAYVVGAHLKVMLEEDYLALNKSRVIASVAKQSFNSKKIATSPSAPRKDAHALASNIIRQIILPEIEKEVNQGKNFSPLRQMFYSMILASWYKMALKETLLTQIYGNQSKVKAGVNQSDPKANEKIFQRYLNAYKKGVFNYIKEDIDPASKQKIAKKYFSGGTNFAQLSAVIHRDQPWSNSAMKGQVFEVDVNTSIQQGMPNKAMVISVADFMQEMLRNLQGQTSGNFTVAMASHGSEDQKQFILHLLGEKNFPHQLISRERSQFLSGEFDDQFTPDDFLRIIKDQGIPVPEDLTGLNAINSLLDLKNLDAYLPDKLFVGGPEWDTRSKNWYLLNSLHPFGPSIIIPQKNVLPFKEWLTKRLNGLMIKRIAVLTGGGLATGHNSLITAAVREAQAQGDGVEILGIPNGWAGLTDPELIKHIRPLTLTEMERYENQGGSIIKSSRTNPVKVDDKEIHAELLRLGHTDLDALPADLKEKTRLALVAAKVNALVERLKTLKIDGLVVMGGDDTNGVSSIIHAFAPDYPILGVPKTMDNDVYLPDGVPTYGYDSFISAATDSLRYDMRSAIDQDRIFIVETFGRDAGFTAIGAAARAGATLTLIPEQGKINIDQLVERVKEFYRLHKHALIVVSEGVEFEHNKDDGGETDQFGHKKLKGAGEALAAILNTRLKDFKAKEFPKLAVTNAAKLDYATREAPISLEDSLITQSLGRDAVRLLRNGVTGKILYTDAKYLVKEMSFPNADGVVTYMDDRGVQRQMNISQLRGDSPDVSIEARRKIGGRIAHIDTGGIDHDAWVAANQAIFGEPSNITRITLELNRIEKEMNFDIAKMSALLLLNTELKQLEFDTHDLHGSATQNQLLQRVSKIKIKLLELIKAKASNIAAGQTNAAMIPMTDGQVAFYLKHHPLAPNISIREQISALSTALGSATGKNIDIEITSIDSLRDKSIHFVYSPDHASGEVLLRQLTQRIHSSPPALITSFTPDSPRLPIYYLIDLYHNVPLLVRAEDAGPDALDEENSPLLVSMASKDPGGIDFNGSKMRINIRKTSDGVPVRFDPAMMARIRREGFDGLNFQIEAIELVTDLPLLLGLKDH
jgi:6-phosphofructokinase